MKLIENQVALEEHEQVLLGREESIELDEILGIEWPACSKEGGRSPLGAVPQAIDLAIHLRRYGSDMHGPDVHPSESGPWSEFYELADRTERVARGLAAIAGVESEAFDVLAQKIHDDHQPVAEIGNQSTAA